LTPTTIESQVQPLPNETFWLEMPSDMDINSLKDILSEDRLQLQPHSPQTHEPEDAAFSQFDRFLEIWEHSKQWSTVWGGISAWPESLEAMFIGASQWGDDSRVREFTLQTMMHAESGKNLLRLLQCVDGQLPTEPRAVKLLVKMHLETAVLLATGIATLEARVSVLKKRYFTVSDSSEIDSILVE
jgi:hypothetical protein